MNSVTEITSTLDTVSIGRRCVVKKLLTDKKQELQSRLLSMGIYPGVTMEVLRRAPLGDPTQLRLNGCLLSIRQSDAQCILVEVVDAAH